MTDFHCKGFIPSKLNEKFRKFSFVTNWLKFVVCNFREISVGGISAIGRALDWAGKYCDSTRPIANSVGKVEVSAGNAVESAMNDAVIVVEKTNSDSLSIWKAKESCFREEITQGFSQQI